MRGTLIAYGATIVVLVVLDLVWLGVIAAPMYQRGIGHLMAERPIVAASERCFTVPSDVAHEQDQHIQHIPEVGHSCSNFK